MPVNLWTSVLYLDANTYKFWGVFAFGTYCAYIGTEYIVYAQSRFIWTLTLLILSLLINSLFSIFIDYLYYIRGIIFYDPRLTVVRGYAYSTYFQDTLHSVGLDYGFNFYDGDYTKARRQAQIDKFEHAISTLGIKKGDKIIDIGCGCGDWLYYLKTEYSCDVYGINITDSQAVECRKRGLNVYTTDWKDILHYNNQNLQEILYGKFDVVSFWDTVEHYVSMGEGLCRRNKRAEIYKDMFTLAKLLLNKKSRLKKVWISCLHLRKEIWKSPGYMIKAILCGSSGGDDDEDNNSNNSENGKIDGEHSNTLREISKMPLKTRLAKILYIYLMDKLHSGYYPSYYHAYEDKNGTKIKDLMFHDGLVDNGKIIGFNLKSRKDCTLDYYMTSVLNPTHFGVHRYTMTIKRFFCVVGTAFLDPFWLHHRFWWGKSIWMYQFDKENINNSDVILWWLHFQLK